MNNWTGFSNIQCPDVPIVNEEHITRKITEAKNLRDVTDWLSSRKYLPIEGKHYQIVDDTAQIGKWKAKWYAIKLLIDDSLLLAKL